MAIWKATGDIIRLNLRNRKIVRITSCRRLKAYTGGTDWATNAAGIQFLGLDNSIVRSTIHITMSGRLAQLVRAQR